jgi:hypothetical protein
VLLAAVLVCGAVLLDAPPEDGTGFDVLALEVLVVVVVVVVAVVVVWPVDVEPKVELELLVPVEMGLVTWSSVAGSDEQAKDRASTVQWLNERFMLPVNHPEATCAQRRFCRPPAVRPLAWQYFSGANSASDVVSLLQRGCLTLNLSASSGGRYARAVGGSREWAQ